jgi:hypothetical protein
MLNISNPTPKLVDFQVCPETQNGDLFLFFFYFFENRYNGSDSISLAYRGSIPTSTLILGAQIRNADFVETNFIDRMDFIAQCTEITTVYRTTIYFVSMVT